MGNFRPFGEVRGEQLQVFVDDAPVAQFDWDKEFGINRGFGFSGDLKTIDVKLPVTAGPHKIGVTFLATDYAPLLDLNNDFERSTIETGGLPGFTFYPHIGSIRIDGPFAAQGAEHSAARERIFVCQPESAADEPAARGRSWPLARRAFRGQQTDHDVEKLVDFYARGREQGGSFDAGIEMALQRLLVDTKFIYRLEAEPTNVAEGDSYAHQRSRARVAAVVLPLEQHSGRRAPGAGRAGQAARAGRARRADEAACWPILARRRSRRISPASGCRCAASRASSRWSRRSRTSTTTSARLFEPRPSCSSRASSTRTAASRPADGGLYVRQRSAREALRHPGRAGQRVPRVTLGPELDLRRGLLGKGSVLTISSQPGRTAPVIRGNWVMSTLLGVPAPQPAAERADARGEEGRRRRQRAHADAARAVRGASQEPDVPCVPRADGSVRLCARAVRCDRPLPHARRHVADQFRRTRCTTAPRSSGPAELRNFVLKYKDRYVTNLAEKLLTYALGRGVEYYDMPAVRAIVAAGAEDDYRLGSLVAAVTASDAFRLNTKVGPAVSRESQPATAATLRPQESTMRFITKKRLSRRTVLRGLGSHDCAAAARRDGAGADAYCARRSSRRHASRASSCRMALRPVTGCRSLDQGLQVSVYLRAARTVSRSW